MIKLMEGRKYHGGRGECVWKMRKILSRINVPYSDRVKEKISEIMEGINRTSPCSGEDP